MWLILGFAAHHVWSAYLVDTLEKSALMGSIFSGYKIVKPETARRARRRIEGDR
jgi:Ni/Fe-hydrogenase 1 B-type cytochrome subunit